jgi:sugar phosphate permease
VANLTEIIPEPAVLETPLAPPTRVRYGVLAFLCSLGMVLYLDRLCIGTAKLNMEKQLGFSEEWWSYIFASFTIAYGIFEIPTGHWGDRFGSRGVLTRIVLWWSAFTALTGACTGLYMLLAVRFLFGAGEAGAMPNIARVLARWFPLAARGRAQSIFITSTQLGGVVAAPVTFYTMEVVGWRLTFFLFGLVGCAWAAAFYWWFRDDPARHPDVNDAERQYISSNSSYADVDGSIPWRQVFRSANVWLLGGSMTCSAFVSYMYMFWYPSYLTKGRGLSEEFASWMTSLVMLGGAVGCLFGGYFADWLISRTGNARASYRFIGVSMPLIAAVLTLISLRSENNVTCVLLPLSLFFLFSQLASWWAVSTEISRPHVGAMIGLMNSMGIGGASASQLLPGHWVDWLEAQGYTGRAAWDPMLYAYVVVLVLCGLLWWGVDCNRPVFDAAAEPHEAGPALG